MWIFFPLTTQISVCNPYTNIHNPWGFPMKSARFCPLGAIWSGTMREHVSQKQMANNWLHWEWRWFTLEQKLRYLWWTVHGGTTILPKIDIFSHGGWNINWWDTKMSRPLSSLFGKECNISAWSLDFASFHPRSYFMTSSFLWPHRRASRIISVVV